MSYTLNHTAEQIDRKLNLINENKNLLPYPYKTTFPAGLGDIGDGSILISALSVPALSEDVLLNTCALPAGKKYIISLNVANLATESLVQDHEAQLVVKVAGKDPIVLTKDATFAELDLSANIDAVAVEVYIGKGTPRVNVDSLIKPQIEEAKVQSDGSLQNAPSDWVPYMDKIGNYVDERFNSVNAKLRDLFAFMSLVEIVE